VWEESGVTMLFVYLCGVAVVALLVGRNTSMKDINREAAAWGIVLSLGWPIVLLLALGATLRNPK